MSDAVSGLAGYNYYLAGTGWVSGAPGPSNHGVKQNNTPVTGAFTITGLTPDTDYSLMIGVTAVDNAGNESSPVAMTAGTAVTLDPTPSQEPMNSTHTAAIDAIVAACRGAGDPAPGVTIAIVSPFGYYTQSYGSGTGNNDYYRIASQTKTFTGTAVLRAVDQGLLSLDDHLSKYVSGVSYADPTIQQMLMMQSGIYNYENNATLSQDFTINTTMAYSVEQIIALIKAGSPGDPSEFTPGTSWYYTNSNHYMLALCVEAVDPSGRTIDVIIQEDILTPLGMVNTYFQTVTGVPASPYAIGYDYRPVIQALFGIDVYLDVSDQNPAFVWAAGAIISVISDMIIWGQELMNGTLLSTEMQQLRQSLFVTLEVSQFGAAYGLQNQGPATIGYGLANYQIGSWNGHDGSWLGYDSCTMFLPATETVISVYENFQTGPPHTLAALSTIWYEIAEYLHPGSTLNADYDEGGPFTGSLSGTIGAPAVALNANVFLEGKTSPFPFTFPATFEYEGDPIGQLAATFGNPEAALTTSYVSASDVDAELQALLGSLLGTQQPQGTLAATAQGLTAALSATSSGGNVVFEAVGAPTINELESTAPSWSAGETAGGDTCVMICYAVVFAESNGTLEVNATVNGSAFTETYAPLTFYSSGGFEALLAVFATFGPPPGTPTVEISTTGTASVLGIAANSLTYQNVASISGTTYTNSGDNAAPGLPSVPCSTGEIIVIALAALEYTFSTFTQTQRWLQNNDAVPTMVIGDATGNSAQSFSAALSSAGPWGAFGLVLTPADGG